MTETDHGRQTLAGSELAELDAWWRAANYLSVGQIYLMDNPLLTEPLRPEHIKPRLLGHWGTTPGLNMLYVHLNRVIKNRDLNAIYVTGPGHGGPGIVANTYLEGTYSELYPHITPDAVGMGRLFKQFSFPGGIPSHAAPETPGSIHEGGELGYSLVHAYGAAFDNPDLIVACVIGDGESETGPLATSWHSNKFLDPARDGAVLPILHLNGYKIANPTVPARIPHAELESLLRGYGYAVHTVEGDDPMLVHQQLAGTLDAVIEEIRGIQHRARTLGDLNPEARPVWPVIVFKTPKGWTGPKTVDGLPVEGTWRAHQVPLDAARTNPEHLAQLEAWMRSYRPGELFDGSGALVPEIARLAPAGDRRMSANPHANGGVLLRELALPDFRDYAVEVTKPGGTTAEATRVLGTWLRDVIKANPSSFRLMGPDETSSNRLDAVFDVTNRAFEGSIVPGDNHLAPDGRVMEVLSEHMCQGWLEGYLLTGRHGLFNCYEAFIHIVDSMFNQHAKWLKVTNHIPWRRPIASLNYLLSSLVWRQDHNGFSHQDPGFIDHVVNKKAEVIRVYLPPDANTLLSTADHCLRSRQYVNVIVAGKQPQWQWLSMDEAIIHCTRGGGHLGVGVQRLRRRARRGDGLLRRRSDPGGAGRGVAAAHPPAFTQGAHGERRGPDAPAAGVRAPARHVRPRVRRAVHHGAAGHLRLPRLPVAHPPADLPAQRARQLPRARVQGGRHDHHAVRHGHAERPGPVPPGHGRHRPGAGAGLHGRARAPADGGQADRRPGLHAGAGRGCAGDHRMELAALTIQEGREGAARRPWI
jgi:xylulose-5-phosphate/fructose-6-phosphate phosphoketolase